MADEGTRRVKLDQRVIVDAVLELARTEPNRRVTFKRLGEALGVDATAMYRHFRNKDELTRAAVDRLFAMAVEPALAARGTWRARLEMYLMRTAELFLEYPSIGSEGALVDPAGTGDAACVEFILEMLSDAGLAGEPLIKAYAAVSGFSLSQGAVLARESMLSGSAVRDGSIPWITTFGAIDLSGYPHIREHRDDLLSIDGISVYRAGIDAILDSIERSLEPLPATMTSR